MAFSIKACLTTHFYGVTTLNLSWWKPELCLRAPGECVGYPSGGRRAEKQTVLFRSFPISPRLKMRWLFTPTSSTTCCVTKTRLCSPGLSHCCQRRFLWEFVFPFRSISACCSSIWAIIHRTAQTPWLQPGLYTHTSINIHTHTYVGREALLLMNMQYWTMLLIFWTEVPDLPII